MNMQTIQILLLLLDGIVKLAPWRIVMETMDRIGYGAAESPVARRQIARMDAAAELVHSADNR